MQEIRKMIRAVSQEEISRDDYLALRALRVNVRDVLNELKRALGYWPAGRRKSLFRSIRVAIFKAAHFLRRKVRE